MGCFQGIFKSENGPLRHSGNGPIKEAKRPMNANGLFSGTPPWSKTAPLKGPMKRSMISSKSLFSWRQCRSEALKSTCSSSVRPHPLEGAPVLKFTQKSAHKLSNTEKVHESVHETCTEISTKGAFLCVKWPAESPRRLPRECSRELLCCGFLKELELYSGKENTWT